MARTHVWNLLLLLALLCLSHLSKTEDGEEIETVEETQVEEEKGVLVLTNENFDSIVPNENIILVEFYAPWCGHCKNLEPEYAKAAQTLKENTPPVPLAKVDATAQEALGKRYDVSGYPTLKIFRKGEPFDYKGPREADGIVKYMQEQADPNWKPPAEAVITLTESNFDEVVNKADLILVEFYAPWCGHCKKLAPEYESAAQMLKTNNPDISLAKVDATAESSLGSRFGVTGYPTLKMFRKGKEYEYGGPRDERGIIEYMQNQAGDSSKLYENLKTVKNYISDQSDITILGFFENEEEPFYRVYLDAGNKMRDDFRFGHTFSKKAREHYKINPNSVVMFIPERFQSKYEPKRYVLEKKESDSLESELQAFYKEHMNPLVGHRTTKNKDIRYSMRPLVVVYYGVDWSFDHRVASQIWRNKVVEVAKGHRDLTFAVAGEDEFQDELKALGLEDSGEEVSVGIWDTDNKKYRMDPDEEFDSDSLQELIQLYKKGKLEPIIKSQPIPKKNDGPVTVVVGKTFQDIVLDKKKDVLIEFYAPWCGHCKKLEPVYKKLGKKYRDNKDLVIAKMDATANDVPSDYSATGFPTIYLAPANNKANPIKFSSSERELESFVKFLEENIPSLKASTSKEEL